MNPVLFWAISAMVLIGAILVVRLSNIFHAGLCLVATFFGVAGLYSMLDAHFLSAVQILIYIGAISIIIMFAVMLTHHLDERQTPIPLTRQAGVASCCIAFAALALAAVWHQSWNVLGAMQDQKYIEVQELGRLFMDKNSFLLPFELVGVLLLAALVGAIMVAWKGREPA